MAQKIGQTPQKPQQTNVSPSRISLSLSNNQKNLIAGFLTIILLAGIYGSVNWFTNPNFRQTILGTKQTSVTQNYDGTSKAIDDLSQSLSQVNPENLIYQSVTLTDLPVYPKAWVERYFTQNEQSNALISGPSADPDNDGLSNKEEYIYGSDPKNANTLCGSAKTDSCSGLTDKQNVQAGVSPLTGFKLDQNQTFKIKRQDYAILNKIQDSFETAAREGVDFPSLFQLSKQIDLNSEYTKVQVKEVPDSRESIFNYSKFRAETLQTFISSDELSGFNQVYGISDVGQLQIVQDKYQDQLTKLEQIEVPHKYIESHRAYIFTFEKLVDLVNHRKDGINNKTLTSDTFKKDSKDIATKVMWAYRKLNDELVKLPNGEEGTF